MKPQTSSIGHWLRVLCRGIQRGVLGEYIACKILGSYHTEKETKQALLVRNRRGIRFHVPKDPQLLSDYLYTIDPLTELNFHPYFSMKDGVFVDVGSFIGKYSLEVAKMHPRNIVVAIEPNPISATLLAKNVQLNKVTSKVRIIRKAIAAEKGYLELTLHGSTSAHATIAHGKHKLVKVPTITFADALREARVDPTKVKLIKIDVEGAQLPILRQVLSNPELSKARIICELLEKRKDRAEAAQLIKHHKRSLVVLDEQNYLIETTRR